MGVTLELKLPENMSFELERVAETKREPKEKIVLFAISSYLETLSEMRDEMRAWDRASDEALSNFERSL